METRSIPTSSGSSFARVWESFYPLAGLDSTAAGTIASLQRTMPDFVRLLLRHRPAFLRGKTLQEVAVIPGRTPADLLEILTRGGSRRRKLMSKQAAPTLVFAVFGRARVLRAGMTPEEEDRLLGKLITHWAVREHAGSGGDLRRPALADPPVHTVAESEIRGRCNRFLRRNPWRRGKVQRQPAASSWSAPAATADVPEGHCFARSRKGSASTSFPGTPGTKGSSKPRTSNSTRSAHTPTQSSRSVAAGKVPTVAWKPGPDAEGIYKITVRIYERPNNEDTLSQFFNFFDDHRDDFDFDGDAEIEATEGSGGADARRHAKGPTCPRRAIRLSGPSFVAARTPWVIRITRISWMSCLCGEVEDQDKKEFFDKKKKSVRLSLPFPDVAGGRATLKEVATRSIHDDELWCGVALGAVGGRAFGETRLFKDIDLEELDDEGRRYYRAIQPGGIEPVSGSTTWHSAQQEGVQDASLSRSDPAKTEGRFRGH